MVVGSSAWISSGVFFGFEEDCGAGDGRQGQFGACTGDVSEGEDATGRRHARARAHS